MVLVRKNPEDEVHLPTGVDRRQRLGEDLCAGRVVGAVEHQPRSARQLFEAARPLGARQPFSRVLGGDLDPAILEPCPMPVA